MSQNRTVGWEEIKIAKQDSKEFFVRLLGNRLHSAARLSAESQEESMDNNNWLKQLLMVGVGTTSIVAEKLREVSDELVRDGKINPEQAKAIVDDMMQQLKTEQGNLEGHMERQMRNMLQDLGVPRQAEMDELRGRIDRLERQVRDLENKLWR